MDCFVVVVVLAVVVWDCCLTPEFPFKIKLIINQVKLNAIKIKSNLLPGEANLCPPICFLSQQAVVDGTLIAKRVKYLY